MTISKTQQDFVAADGQTVSVDLDPEKKVNYIGVFELDGDGDVQLGQAGTVAINYTADYAPFWNVHQAAFDWKAGAAATKLEAPATRLQFVLSAAAPAKWRVVVVQTD